MYRGRCPHTSTWQTVVHSFTGIGVLDAQARAAGVPVLAGASSVPALSGAVVRHLSQSMETVTAVEVAITASNRASAGTSVAAAILSYVGKPIRLWRGQRQTTATGWQELRREDFSLQDGTSLDRRWLALADVPDLDLPAGAARWSAGRNFPGRYGSRFANHRSLAVKLDGEMALATIIARSCSVASSPSAPNRKLGI